MIWPNRDPIDEWGGENLYGFADNNPPSSFDPDGRNPILIKWLLRLMPKTGSGDGNTFGPCALVSEAPIPDSCEKVCIWRCKELGKFDEFRKEVTIWFTTNAKWPCDIPDGDPHRPGSIRPERIMPYDPRDWADGYYE